MSRQEAIEELIVKIGDFTHIDANGIWGRLDPDIKEYRLEWEKDGIQLYYDYIGQNELVILGVSRTEFDYIRNQFK